MRNTDHKFELEAGGQMILTVEFWNGMSRVSSGFSVQGAFQDPDAESSDNVV